MKAIICLVAIIGVAVAYPQYEGAQYTNEAIQQARNTHLIPQNAQIDSVNPSVALTALENIPGNQQIDLSSLLRGQFPPEVLRNLQSQIDSVGRH